MCGFQIEETQELHLRKIKVKDSKLLTRGEREDLYTKILKISDNYKIVIINPQEIDMAVQGHDGLNLNWLEANKSAEIYKKELKEYDTKIILFLPTFEEIIKRNKMRPPRLRDEEITWTYKLQENLTVFDEKIDNTNLTAEDTAERLKR